MTMVVTIRAWMRAAAFLVLTLGLLPLYAVASLTSGAISHLIQRLWCELTLRILGVKLRRLGRPFHANPVLLVANHVSYLDILAMGREARATFIAKLEIADWPLFGLLGRLAGTLFVRRYWRDALIQRNSLGRRMRAGESFILFAEGTSSDGFDVLPFKTSLLSVAEPWVIDRPIAVQPVTLRFTRMRDGAEFSRENASLFSWYGDDEFFPHLWRLMHQSGVELEVIFGEPVISWSVRSRKVLGHSLRRQIRNNLGGCRTAPSPSVDEDRAISDSVGAQI